MLPLVPSRSTRSCRHTACQSNSRSIYGQQVADGSWVTREVGVQKHVQHQTWHCLHCKLCRESHPKAPGSPVMRTASQQSWAIEVLRYRLRTSEWLGRCCPASVPGPSAMVPMPAARRSATRRKVFPTSRLRAQGERQQQTHLPIRWQDVRRRCCGILFWDDYGAMTSPTLLSR